MTDKESIETTLRLLWRTSGFLTGLAQDIKSIAPERAEICRAFIKDLDAEAKRIFPDEKDMNA